MRIALQSQAGQPAPRLALGSALILASLFAAEAPAPVSLALFPTMVCGSQACEEQTRLTLLQGALTAAVERRPLRALSEEELFVSAGGDLSRRIKSCGPELTCICSAASSLPVELLFVLIASFDRRPAVIGLRLIDRHACRIVSQAVAEPGAKDDLARVVEQLANDVLERAGHRRYSRVRFELQPADALVMPSPSMSPEPGDPRAFKSNPGPQKVTVSAPGYVSKEVELELAPDQETRVNVQLEPESSIVESPWLWVAIGAVVAAAATGAVLYGTRSELVCVPPAGANCEL